MYKYLWLSLFLEFCELWLFVLAIWEFEFFEELLRGGIGGGGVLFIIYSYFFIVFFDVYIF